MSSTDSTKNKTHSTPLSSQAEP